MVEFAYNNAKNVNISYIFFEFNCNFYLYISFEEDIDLCLKFCLAKKWDKKLKNLILIY